MPNTEITYLDTGLSRTQFLDLINKYSQLIFGQYVDDEEKQPEYINTIAKELNIDSHTANAIYSYWQKNKKEDSFFTSLVHCYTPINISLPKTSKELSIVYCSFESETDSGNNKHQTVIFNFKFDFAHNILLGWFVSVRNEIEGTMEVNNKLKSMVTIDKDRLNFQMRIVKPDSYYGTGIINTTISNDELLMLSEAVLNLAQSTV